MKQKGRGFTLIELLAVIVILAIIALIAVPVIMNIISESRKSAFKDTAYGLINAGEMYYASALLNDGMSGDTEFTIENGEFTGENKLDVKGSLPESGKIKVSKDGKVALAITNGSICIKKGYNDTKPQVSEEFETCDLPAKTLKDIATTTTEVTSVATCATDGTICEPGTKFAIKVNNSETYNFYVVSDASNKVTLIMDRNVDEETVAWISDEDYGCGVYWCSENEKGPLTALNYLESKTSGWTNIEAKTYILKDDNEPKLYYDITRTKARARMLTKTEALSVGCKENNIGCPTWLYANLRVEDTPHGFWLSSASVNDIFYALGVDCYEKFSVQEVYSDTIFGVRPVIEIAK